MERSATPATVRGAAFALAAYAVVVFVNATVLQAMNDWEGVAEYPRGVARALVVGFVAWGLLRRARWAWWLGVGFSLFWIATGSFALAVLLRLRTAETDALLPPGFYFTLGITIALLVAAAVLLLIPVSRGAFRSATPTT